MDNGGLLGTPVPGAQQQTPTYVANPNVQVKSPVAGMSQIANALVNGYLGYQQQQNQNAPTQLSGASMQPGVLGQLWNGFMSQGQAQDPTQAMAAPVGPQPGDLY